MDSSYANGFVIRRISPEEIGLFTEPKYSTPFSTVSIPREYQGVRRRHRPGRGWRFRK